MALGGIDTASLGAYDERNAQDPVLVRLRRRLVLDFREGWPQTLAEMEIELADGRRVAARHDAGIPARDIGEQGRRLAAKFDALVAPLLGAPRARELREAVFAVDDISDIGRLAALAAD
jgi:hypothetical protein